MKNNFLEFNDFNLSDITLFDKYYLNVIKKDVDFLNTFNPEKLLFNFRLTAGFELSEIKEKSSYSGWENTRIGGHTIGHYLTAAAQGIARGFGDEKGKDGLTLRERLEKIIDGLYECQLKNDELIKSNKNRKKGFIFGATMADSTKPELQFDKVESDNPSDTWVPWYTMHKIVNGLVETYKFTSNKKALEIAENLSEWIFERTDKWTEEIQDRVLSIEYGGMNDCLYELYKCAEKENYSNLNHIEKAAHKFDQVKLYKEIFNSTKDALDNKHANTTIPKYMGALNRYRTFPENADSKEYLEYTKKFWDLVVNHHTYITGGNSECEHFGKDDVLDKERSNCNCETCNTHNMLKITRELFKITGDKKYADYYENTFINSIMASVNSDNGMTTYFQPMATGCFKIFCNPDVEKNYFWCCTGTGLENFTKLGDSFYFYSDNILCINEFVSSSVYWKEENLIFEQKASLPESDKINFKIKTNDKKEKDFKLLIRIPDWADENKIKLKINKKSSQIKISKGYIQIDRTWKNLDSVDLVLSMKINVFSLPDNFEKVFAFKYGPVVLAADLGKVENKNIRQVGVLCDVCGEKTVWNESMLLKGNYGGTSNLPVLENEKIFADKKVIQNINKYVKIKGKEELYFELKYDKSKKPLILRQYYKMNKNRYGIYWLLKDDDKKILESEKNILDGIGVGYGAQTEGNETTYPCFKETGSGSTGDAGALTRFANENGSFSYLFCVSKDKETYLSFDLLKNDDAKGIVIKSDDILIAKIEQDFSSDEKVSKEIKIPSEVIEKSIVFENKKVVRISFEGIDGKESVKLCAPVNTFEKQNGN